MEESGIKNGILTVFSRHTTAAIIIQENEPLLLEDFKNFLDCVAPEEADYRHNDFNTRTVHMHEDECPNGHSHCRQLVLGTSESVPLIQGEMSLGQWQRIFFVELDIETNFSNLLSGTGTTPMFGSIVQNGKFSA